ncbi:replication protein A 70 kDa DNA-binding subunit B-like [Juglans microcarpa x Juglans regia]|uniref:replication protein A 70 kDa DNA-binding subunit B-like n=1 Tax=Juglans microcarpa x Juglans regia TaxID=2249226 RepID=UPI001B7F4824|nr:replication protein A 70 kDa DNA-binding subunit B-like [Juglans microcarpa x Juglans regia]
MRARLDPVFSEYVLELGNGMPPITVDETIKIPDGMLVPYEDDCTSLNHLIDAVFHDIHGYSINISAMMNRAILTPKNIYVDEINALLIHRFPGELRRYYSFDEAIDASEQSVMEDFLNTLTPNGLPPHELLLKINCPIMLLRNINPSEGLCNGTRLICRAFDRNVIDAEIAVGHHRGKRVFIPRIPFLPNVDENSALKMRTIYTSIKDITPNTRNWKMKMIVADKSPKRTGQRSPVKYQSLTLIDPEGNRVQATMFDKDIDSRDDTLHIFQSYYISNAYVRPLDPRYRIETHEYQWILNSRTIIEEVLKDEEQLELPKYQLIPFNEFDAYKNSIAEIDVLAVAIHIKPCREITSAHGPTTIQEIYVIDQSLNPISLTMWGQFVQDECKKISEIIGSKPVILGTRIRVGSYNGLSLSSRPKSKFMINPALPEATSLQQWAVINDLLLERIIAKCLTYPSTSLSSVGIREIIKNCDVAEFIKSLQPMQKAKFWIKAKIIVVDLRQIFYYMSCIGCNKGTGYDYNDTFLCYHCKHQSISQPRCRAYVELDDGTGRLSAIMFGEVVEQTFGCSAVELMNHTGDEHLPYIENLVAEVSQKEWMIELLADPNRLNQQQHKNFNVVSVDAVQDDTK